MRTWPEALLVVLILLPLVAAVVAVVAPRAGRVSAQIVAAVGLLGAGVLAREVSLHDVVAVRIGGWSAPLGIELRLDGLAALMLLATAVVGFAVCLYAPRYFRPVESDGESAGEDRDTAQRFWPLFCLLLAALIGLFCSADVFNLYVTLELMSFAAVLLVAVAGERAALMAAMRYLLVSLCASMFYLLGVALVYGQTGTVDLALLSERLPDGTTGMAALVLMTTGLVMKAALFPMHFWLPAAHGNAPAPVSALLSALVVKAAFYILLRLWLEALQGPASAAAAQVLGGLGGLAIVWGSVQALRQTQLKRLVAYSTVAQLGYLFIVFPLTVGRGELVENDAYSGAVLFFVGHACAKTAMFLVAGNILYAAGHDRIADLAGQVRAMPVSSFAFALAALSLVGLPPSLGFAGKWLLMSAAMHQGQWWWAIVLVLGGLLTAAYLLKVFVPAFRDAPLPETPRLPRIMIWVPAVLALLAATLGLLAHWPAGLAIVGVEVVR